MTAEIKITNSADNVATIDIEGIIGMPEQWQFDSQDERVATYERFRQSIKQIADLKVNHVIVNIRSTGGDVNDALLIYDALRSLDAKVTTRCYGYAASAATIIAQGASEGERELSSGSLYLIHNSVCACEGNSLDLQQKTQLLDQTDRRIAEIYAERSGRDARQFLDMMNENSGDGRWLSPQQTIDSGLADRIIQHSDNEKTESGKVKATLLRIGRCVNAFLHPAAESGKSAEDIRGQYEAMRQELRQRRMSIEARNAQNAAQPTRTKETEDPPVAEFKLSDNRSAYEQDARNFRN